MNNIMFFSDVHGSPESVELLLHRISQRNPQLLVLLGDILYHGPRNPLRSDYAPPKVVEQINQFKNQLIAVRGNCDCEVDQMLLQFPIMSDYSTLMLDSQRFFLTHGHLWSVDNLPPIPAGTVFASGHTHIPKLEVLTDSGVIAFNPGSTSLPKGGWPASYGVYENARLQVLNLESDEVLLSLDLQN